MLSNLRTAPEIAKREASFRIHILAPVSEAVGRILMSQCGHLAHAMLNQGGFYTKQTSNQGRS